MTGEHAMTDNTNVKNMRVKQPQLFEDDLPLSRRNLPRYKKNPFVDDDLITQLSGVKNIYYTQLTKSAILDMETGAYDPARLQIVKQVKADKEQFVKIYTTHLKAFFELSTSAFKLLQYVLFKIQTTGVSKDKIHLSLISAQNFFEEQNSKISSSTYYRATKELVEKLFIAETLESNFYFINPKLFFNGDRIDFITSFHTDGESPFSEKSKIENDEKKLEMEKKDEKQN